MDGTIATNVVLKHVPPLRYYILTPTIHIIYCDCSAPAACWRIVLRGTCNKINNKQDKKDHSVGAQVWAQQNTQELTQA